MAEEGISLGEAVTRASDLHAEILAHFLTLRASVVGHTNGMPSWGENVDAEVEKYIDGLGQ